MSTTTSGAQPASKAGVMYMAFGERSLKAAINSYHSLLQFCHFPAVIVGDYPTDEIPHIPWTGETPWQNDEPIGQRFYAGRVKPFFYRLSPFEKTLYLDADTEIYRDITPGFDLLDKWDICIADDPRTLESTFRVSKQGPRWDWIREQRDFTHNYIGKASNPQINTGVIFFRKSVGSGIFFTDWYREWMKFPRWDEQMPFMRAEHNCRVTKIYHLPTIWNTNSADRHDKIIYHMWGLQKARDLYAD